MIDVFEMMEMVNEWKKTKNRLHFSETMGHEIMIDDHQKHNKGEACA